MVQTPPHLGGHQGVTHVDRGALEFMQTLDEIKTMVDVGCGPGGQVELARSMGIDAIGIDGDPALPDSDWLIRHDFTMGTPERYLVKNGDESAMHDMAWSVEFLEHVDEKHLDGVFQVFARCRWVVMTAAPPGKGGHHHVNCRDWLYWLNQFEQYGLRMIAIDTIDIRESSTMKREFMREHGLVFMNTHYGEW